MGILLKEHFNRWYSLKSYYISVTLLDLPISVNANEFIYLYLFCVCAISLFLSLKIRIKSNRFSLTHICHPRMHCVRVWAQKISHTWFIFIWFSVSRHNDLFRFNLHYNESTAWTVPFRHVPGDMRGCHNCWSKYWSDGWRLVRCGGKSNFFRIQWWWHVSFSFCSLLNWSANILFRLFVCLLLKNGTFLAPTITIPMMMFAGFGVTLRDLPEYMKWGSHVSFMRYGLEGFVGAIYGEGRKTLDCNAIYCHYRWAL